jgi:hypothetical protein
VGVASNPIFLVIMLAVSLAAMAVLGMLIAR